MDPKKESGSVFVETALMLPVFIVVLFTIIFMANVYIVHNLVQYGITQTANELSTYTYILEWVGLNDMLEDAVKQADQKIYEIGYNANSRIDKANNACNAFISLMGGDSAEPADDLVTLIEDGSKTVGYIKKDINTIKGLTPMTIIKSLGKLAASTGVTALKDDCSRGMGMVLGGTLSNKYIDNERLAELGVTNRDLTSDGLDLGCFYGSRFGAYYGKDDQRNSKVIDIVVTYRIKMPINLKLLPESASAGENSIFYNNSILITQRVTTLGWTDGKK
ncbi:MAG: TadE/TadG family type IV pilus assembly protein [Huintestinicola sp.]